MTQKVVFDVGPRGIWRFSDTDCAVGAVVFAHHAGRVAVVRKAPVDGYEFSGRWALPGGIVRGENPGGMWDALQDSVKSRAFFEAGLQLKELSIPEGEWGSFYPITSYTVRGEKKFTAVVPVIATLDQNFALSPSDRSIDAAKWVSFVDLSSITFAPANAVIVHNLSKLVDGLEVNEPLEARAICNANAELLFNQGRS